MDFVLSAAQAEVFIPLVFGSLVLLGTLGLGGWLLVEYGRDRAAVTAHRRRMRRRGGAL